MLNKHSVIFQVANKSILAIRIKLGNISNALEQESIPELTSSRYKFIQLSFPREHICISLISSKIDSESYKLFSYNRFWTVNNQLVYKRNAISVCECSFGFVFETQVVKQFDYLSSEPRSFKSVH